MLVFGERGGNGDAHKRRNGDNGDETEGDRSVERTCPNSDGKALAPRSARRSSEMRPNASAHPVHKALAFRTRLTRPAPAVGRRASADVHPGPFALESTGP